MVCLGDRDAPARSAGAQEQSQGDRVDHSLVTRRRGRPGGAAPPPGRHRGRRAGSRRTAGADHPHTRRRRTPVRQLLGQAGRELGRQGRRPTDIRASRYTGYTLDRAGLASALDRAPQERIAAADADALVVSLPTPDGEFQRFELVDSPVMAPGLAARHPEIRTYAGKGLDDPTARVRADLTPLGFHASVRSEHGVWYVDPYSRQTRAGTPATTSRTASTRTPRSRSVRTSPVPPRRSPTTSGPPRRPRPAETSNCGRTGSPW